MGLILFPVGAMSLIYPVGPADLDDLAYFFTTEPDVGPLRYIESLKEEIAKNPGITALVQAARDWGAAYGAGTPPGAHHGRSWRRPGHHRHPELRRGRQARAVRAGPGRLPGLRRGPAPDRLAGVLDRDFGLETGEDELAEVTGPLLAARLLLELDGRLVSLALPGPVPAYPDYTQFPGGYVTAGPPRRGVPMSPTAPDLRQLNNPQLIAPPRQLTLDQPLLLDCGRTLPRATINFETYGCLTDCGDNAILVCHSLTHRAHAAGRHSAVGPGPRLVGRRDRPRQAAGHRQVLRDLHRCPGGGRHDRSGQRGGGHRPAVRDAFSRGDRAGHGERAEPVRPAARPRPAARGDRRLPGRPAGAGVGDRLSGHGAQRRGDHHHARHLGAHDRDLRRDASPDPRRPAAGGTATTTGARSRTRA